MFNHPSEYLRTKNQRLIVSIISKSERDRQTNKLTKQANRQNDYYNLIEHAQ